MYQVPVFNLWEDNDQLQGDFYLIKKQSSIVSYKKATKDINKYKEWYIVLHTN